MNTLRLFLFLLGIFILFFTACHAQTRKTNNKLYDALLKKLLANPDAALSVSSLIADSTEYIYVDAREKAEYDISHLPKAIWVGYSDFDLSRLPPNLPKEQNILVYCSIGYRSEKITQKLKEAGYQSAYNLYGGIFEWANQSQTLHNAQGEPTKRVHAYDRAWGIWLQKGEKVY